MLLPQQVLAQGFCNRPESPDQLTLLAAEEHVYAGSVQAFRRVELAVAASLAGLIVIVPVMVRMVYRGRSALTGRVGGIQQPGWPLLPQHACCLRSLMRVFEIVIRNLVAKGVVVGGPVGQEGSWARFRPRFLAGLWHNAYVTTNAVLAPGRPR